MTGASFCVQLRCGELPAQEIFLRKQADGSFSNLTHTFEFLLAEVKESQVSASITDQQGREVATQDIHLFDPDADIMAFSERGNFDNGFVKRDPRTNSSYFILIRQDLNLIPKPAEWYRFESMGYMIHRLRFEVGQQFQVLFEDGEELWSSIGGDRSRHFILPDKITPKCEFSSMDNASLYDPKTTEIILRISGIGDAEILSAQWRSRQLCIELPQPATQLPWRIRGLPKLEALLASRVLLKLRVRLGEVEYRTQIEWKPSVVGIFEQSRGRTSCGQFFATRNNEQLKRGRYTIIPKLLMNDQWLRGLRYCLFEGDRFVSELREGSPQSLYDLGGYGQSLSIRHGQFNFSEQPVELIGEVSDKGLFQLRGDVNPRPGLDYDFDAWGAPEMGEEHILHYGTIHEQTKLEAANERLVFVDDKAMFAPFPDQLCDYLVLAYAGTRLATWWRVPKKDGSSWSSNLAEIADDVDARRAAFIIRWAKLPILSKHHYFHVKEFFRRFPHVVLGEWLCGYEEREDGRKIEGENPEAWHDAVRAIIQGFQISHDELTTEMRQKLIHCLAQQDAQEASAKALDTFRSVGICDPVLMGRMIQYWRSIVTEHGIAGQMRTSLLHGLGTSVTMMEKLQSLLPLSDEFFLDGIIKAGIKAVTNPALDNRDKQNLKSALTIPSFRRILYRRIVEQYLL